MHSKARWIEMDEAFPTIYNQSHTEEFLKTFDLQSIPENVVLSISGMGFYHVLLNGREVTSHLLTPPFTAYDKRVYYDEYDVTPFLNCGSNELTVQLGAGWYAQSAPDAWEFEHAAWHAHLQMIASLTAGEECICATDSTWKSRFSRTVFSQLRQGETFDASMEEDVWHAVRIARGPGGLLQKYDGPPIVTEEVLEPVSSHAVSDGVLFDFGVNLAGNCEITVSGPRGSKLSLQYAEKLTEDGDLDPSNIHSLVYDKRFQQDEYITAGNGEERWHSLFTYNGFRYVKVTGDAALHKITARGFHTDLPEAGGFECDQPLLNRIQQALLRSTKTNFHHMPTDCPHREKNGWTGDAHLSAEQALFNLDIAPAYRKWFRDIADVQRPSGALPSIIPTSVWGYNWGNGVSWDCVCVLLPWECYLATGDESFLRDSFPVMEKYIDYMTSLTENHISTIGLGDWCHPKQAKQTSTPALLTAISISLYECMAKICRILGRANDKYELLAKQTRQAFQETFIGKCVESQTYLAMLLYYGLTDDPEETARRLAEEIRAADGHMLCGIFGSKMLLDVLTDHGYFNLAYEIACKEDEPSIGHMLSNGSGTLWEDFGGSSSLNHHMFSPIGAWFYKAIAGIRIQEPGWKAIRVVPHIPKDMHFFRAWHNTPHGCLEVCWKDGCLLITAPSAIKITVDTSIPYGIQRT